jgi:hypothetical protein
MEKTKVINFFWLKLLSAAIEKRDHKSFPVLVVNLHYVNNHK